MSIKFKVLAGVRCMCCVARATLAVYVYGQMLFAAAMAEGCCRIFASGGAAWLLYVSRIGIQTWSSDAGAGMESLLHRPGAMMQGSLYLDASAVCFQRMLPFHIHINTHP